jgi:PAS domain S-box-containing protein
MPMKHVLIVEDHEENRSLLKLLLEVNGYRVTGAGDGLEALAAARRDPPDAVVSDALMPNMGGFELCRAWTQDAALKAIPFIFYSATYVRDDDEKFALALGAVRYLIKPLEAEAFLAELRAVLQDWTGRPAPVPAKPLDETAAHALHESALARKLGDKIVQLELATRRLEESETRFRNLTEMSSDFYWESDTEHRLVQRTSASKKTSSVSLFERGAQIGERRWDIPYLSPDAAGWAAHRAMLDAHQPFRQFELSRLGTDGTERFISISGDPVFDAAGTFIGYRGVGTDITVRKCDEQALRESEDRYSDLVENSQDLICTHDLEGKLLSVNAAAVWFTGYAQEALVGRNLTDLLDQGARAGFAAYLDKIRIEGTAHGLMKIRTSDGRTRWWEYHNTLRTEGVAEPVVRGRAQDITERRIAEEQVRRVKRIYATLSHTNEILARARSEEDLFADMCRVAVERGGMRGAVVRIADEKAKILRHVAFAGTMEKLLAELVCSTDPARPEYQTSASIAFRENRIVIRNAVPAELSGLPWNAIVLAAGIGSFAAIPLRRGGEPIGVFMLNAAEPGFFDDEMNALLDRMLVDVAYALDNLEYERQRKRAERELLEAEARFRSLVEQSFTGIFIVQDKKLAYCNPRFAEILGYSSEAELLGKDLIAIAAGNALEAPNDTLRRLFEEQDGRVSHTFSAARKDGSIIEIGLQGNRGTYQGRPAILGMMQDISEKKRAEDQIQHYVAQLENAFMSTVQVATTLGEMRDPYTGGHQRKVAEIAVAIGAALGFDARRQEGLRVAGYLHDIGKITIPAEILSKPGKLNTTEYQLIQGHAQASYDVLKGVEFPWPVAEVALQHHERMDGSGYPQGLEGDAILLEARIMAVADVLEAMSSHRPYRPGLGIEKALAEIERGRGSAYDADVVDACLRLFREQQYRLPG